MASRLVRGTAIGCGVAALVGGGVGFAVGEPVTPDDLVPARALPKDLCARIGDVSSLLPKASGGPVTMTQGGSTAVTCQAGSSRAKVRAYTSASVKVTVTAYGGRDAGAGNPPFTPEQMAKRTFGRSPWKAVEQDRPYPTKVSRSESGLAGESWTVHALVQRADVVVLVDYTASPIEADSAQRAALALADRAIWESK
ncbi:hypothetical protein [Kribbella sp. HUAS MG21]|uniref:DUF3558 domain-containing protein n=1 Tax=Kribbella sp. HUAS MG21 TaxID=3160966 RepID=A0AAU7TJ05_9ACTN